jgi:hypothetical protein
MHRLCIKGGVSFFVGLLVEYCLLLREFGPYVIIFMNVCCYNSRHSMMLILFRDF